MAAAELAFEILAGALETTRGTAVTPPTFYLPINGTITPSNERYRASDSDGTLSEFRAGRSKIVHWMGDLKASGGLDPVYAPLLMNMLVKGGVTTPTTPSGATLSRLWTFARTMNADDLASFTGYWGDPNIKVWQAPYCMLEEFTIAADSAGSDGATIDLTGWAQKPVQLGSPPTLPSQLAGDILAPGDMQMWLDTSSAIGTSEITDRLVKASLKFNNGLTRKNGAKGPGSDKAFRRVGRKKSHPECTVSFEVPDMNQYSIYEQDTYCKLRVRLNGSLIETGFYTYIQWDMWGKLDAPSWGDLEGTNRTVEFTVMGERDVTAGTDLIVTVQNARTSLV